MSSFIGKLVITVVVIVVAIPGLIIEPGPVSELAALGVLSAVWVGDMSASEAAGEVAEESTGS